MPPDWPTDLQHRLREFAQARDWDQYHTPRNLAALIASEAGELLALFRWDQDALGDDRRKVEDEVADVLLGLLRFADVAGIDLPAAGSRKLEKNASKYPAGATGPDGDSGSVGVVCGIDAGTFTSNSCVAWLRGREFRLGRYRPSRTDPLPLTPPGWPAPRVIALDLPQSLPRAGTKRRVADAAAATPTNALPGTRAELQDWRLYRGLIEAGVDTYWTIHTTSAGAVAGLAPAEAGAPVVVETYPRYVLRLLWPDFPIPSKRKYPDEYTEQVWALLEAAGYCAAIAPGRPDHVDAMLCAVAAQAYLECGGFPPGTVGAEPYIDEDERVIREGYIVAP
jgi:dCTP diphosphatase